MVKLGIADFWHIYYILEVVARVIATGRHGELKILFLWVRIPPLALNKDYIMNMRCPECGVKNHTHSIIEKSKASIECLSCRYKVVGKNYPEALDKWTKQVRSLTGKASDCGSEDSGFDPQPPDSTPSHLIMIKFLKKLFTRPKCAKCNCTRGLDGLCACFYIYAAKAINAP